MVADRGLGVKVVGGGVIDEVRGWAVVADDEVQQWWVVKWTLSYNEAMSIKREGASW